MEKKNEIIKLKRTLFFVVGFNFLLTLSGDEGTTIFMMSIVTFFNIPNFIRLFKLYKSGLRENFSINVIIKSFIEIIVFILVLIYGYFYIKVFDKIGIEIMILIFNVCLLISTRALEVCYRDNSTRSNFFAQMNDYGDINQDINFWWRTKIWFNPSFDGEILKKAHTPRLDFVLQNLGKTIFVMIVLMIPVISMDISTELFLILLLIGPFIVSIFIVIEAKLKAYVKFEGVCIEVKPIYESNRNSFDRPLKGYEYRIVDFHNKREITINYKHGEIFRRYNSGDKIVVIHGVLSKRVLQHYKTSKNF